MKKILFLLTMIMMTAVDLNAQVASGESKISDTMNRTGPDGKFGYWTEKVADITYKGEYVADKKVKNWVGYYPNNYISRIEYFEKGLKEGISIQFDRKCKISLVEHFKNGLANGQTIVYSQYNETPSSEAEYLLGKKNGQYRQYYDNGKIQEETWFKVDLKDGLSKWNNKNGQRVAEYNYKAGNFNGLQTTFYDNDTLQSTNNYQDNKLSGETKEYYRNGKLKLSGKYVNGLKDGAWTEYNELGKVEKVTRYKVGEEIKK